jgi:hypothetical protein
MTWTATVDNTGMSNPFAHVVGYCGPWSWYHASLDDWVLVDIGDANGELLTLSPQYGTGLVSFSTIVPADPSLNGFPLYTQGFGFGGTGGVNLHNAYDLVVGSY